MSCVRVLLRGAVSFSLEQCGDYLHDSPSSQMEAHDDAVAHIESSALAIVQSDLLKGVTESACVLCELGSSSLRRALYEWQLDHCPQTLAKLASGEELEEFLLRHDYSVGTMESVNRSFSTTTIWSRGCDSPLRGRLPPEVPALRSLPAAASGRVSPDPGGSRRRGATGRRGTVSLYPVISFLPAPRD